MSKIYGSLYVTNNDWRYVYNTLLNYFNQEISTACNEAKTFYEESNSLSKDDFLRKLNTYFEENEITDFRKSLIKNSLIKMNSKITKPKKNMFNSFTNRSTYIHTPDVNIDFDKTNRTVTIQTNEFDDFDKYLANNTFISEFVNLVNTINWPTRTGPKKTTRGCTLLRTDPYNNKTVFLSSGPNPPQYNSPSEVVRPPNFVQSQAMKNIKLTSTTKEETFQPVPEKHDLSNM
jgi:hypothetical protein